MNSAAVSSAEPPISPIITTAGSPGSGLEQGQSVHEVGAHHRVAADSHAGRLADAQAGQLVDRLVGERAGSGTRRPPDRARDLRGHDADATLLRRHDRRGSSGPPGAWSESCAARSSRAACRAPGMPSVMHTASARPASAASRMASAAPGGGTKITDAFAPVFSTASRTVSKTGMPSMDLAAACPGGRRPRPGCRSPGEPGVEAAHAAHAPGPADAVSLVAEDRHGSAPPTRRPRPPSRRPRAGSRPA